MIKTALCQQCLVTLALLFISYIVQMGDAFVLSPNIEVLKNVFTWPFYIVNKVKANRN